MKMFISRSKQLSECNYTVILAISFFKIFSRNFFMKIFSWWKFSIKFLFSWQCWNQKGQAWKSRFSSSRDQRKRSVWYYQIWRNYLWLVRKICVSLAKLLAHDDGPVSEIFPSENGFQLGMIFILHAYNFMWYENDANANQLSYYAAARDLLSLKWTRTIGTGSVKLGSPR